MRKYAVISSLLHICILLLAYFGLLTWKHKELDIMQPIPVEVFQVAEQTQSPKPVQESLKIEDIKETKEEVKPLPQEDPPEEKPKEEPKPEPKQEPKPEPDAEVLPKLEEKPKPKPEPKKEELKPKKEEKPKDKPKEKPKPKKEAPRDFTSVLKDLQNKKTKSEGTSKTAQTLNSDGFSGQQGSQVTVSELDIVRRQIEEVWSLPAGVKQVQEMAVPIKIWMNPDRTVRDARVIDTAMLSNTAYNTLAESALRAVLTFKDKPLLLPIGKYNVWKELKITFDPRNIL